MYFVEVFFFLEENITKTYTFSINLTNNSNMPSLIRLFVLIQCITIIISRNLDITCPSNPKAPPDSNPLLSAAERDNLALDSSCFAMDIRLKVENILPDPSYIQQETNINTIENALQKILITNNIYQFDITSLTDKSSTWSINNHCTNEKDETVNKFSFQTTPHTIHCTERTLALSPSSVECKFNTPDSIAYIFNIESISLSIGITGSNIIMEASIMNMNKGIITKSDTTKITNPHAIHEFVFSKQPATLIANTTYLMSINVVSTTSFELKSVEIMPSILTNAEPNACYLAWSVADDPHMFHALSALCYEHNIEKKQLFERAFYQQGTSQNYIDRLSTYGIRRRLLDNDRSRTRPRYSPSPPNNDESNEEINDPRTAVVKAVSGFTTNRGSLYTMDNNGTRRLIANDKIFPNYEQCVAIDEDTFRLFSVGGEINGIAMDRLAVYQIDNTIQNAELISEEYFKLDEPRVDAMCYHYKNKNTVEQKEYIIVINGMNTKGDINTNNWYNDIVFKPVNIRGGTSKNINLPKINLKYNVIDMTPVVTETNDLYLFGGRDGMNAQNYIQMVDLNQVFDPMNINNEFTTMERMEPMISDVVIPFIDFPMIDNKTCIMIFGGQNYVNNEWIDTESNPNNKLQLYCNDNIIKKDFLFQPHSRYFTKFDRIHLQNVNNFDDVRNTNNIFITKYNFTNDSIWYEFDATFKLCFNNLQTNEHLSTILNIFDKDVLMENILTESRRNFQRWNDGFSKINITDINIIKTESTALVTDCIGLTKSICDSLIIASGNGAVNGDKECAYNIKTNDCYNIQRAETNTDKNDNTVQNVHDHNERNAKLYLAVAVMCGIVIGLLIFIISGTLWVYVKKKNVELKVINDAVAMELGMVNTETTSLNTNDICVR
eukprot:451176_1